MVDSGRFRLLLCRQSHPLIRIATQLAIPGRFRSLLLRYSHPVGNRQPV